MLPIPDRSSLLRFPEGTVLNHKYVLISAGVRAPEPPLVPASCCDAENAGSPAASARYVTPLGHGGSSVVFLAHQLLCDNGMELQVLRRAVKFYLLSPELVRHYHPHDVQAANLRNLRNEIKNLTGVEHANILKVIDAGVCERWGMPVNYLVTEYVPGPTLRDVLACRQSKQRTGVAELAYRRLRAEPALILRILYQLCTVVEYLHGHSMYHCDIAPKNIFLHCDDGCRPVLGDFTLGRQIDDWGSYKSSRIGGAMRYAPEPVRRHQYRNDGRQEFASYATYWDVFGLAKSMRDLLGLAPAGAVVPWKSALLRYLGEAMREENAVTAARLRRRIGKLLQYIR